MKRLPYLSIALISASALSYEILLMKLFSIIQWHHFAYMIISLALLGYGASGTFLTLAREWLIKYFPYAYIGNIILFAVSSMFCFIIAQQIPFNPLEILWEYKQLFWLFGLYLLLALPFFFAANAIGLAFIYYKTDISRLYGADLLGAGLGSLSILLLLYFFFPASILQVIALAALLAAAIGFRELSLKPKAGVLLIFAFLFLAVLLTGGGSKLNINKYKDLSQTLQISGVKIIEELSSPLGMLSVVQSPDVPFRYVPGLSMASDVEPLQQLGVFTNGDGMSAITKYPDKMEKLGYLDYQTSALAYHLGDLNKVLILGAGGGSDILQALYHKTKEINAVEIDPQMVDLVRTKYAGFAGNIYDKESITVHTAEARGFIVSSKEKYDLIQMTMVDSFGASSAGLQSLSENYLYTVEALQLYLQHLQPEGYLSFTRWLKLPPRDTLKLFATAIEALERNGVEDPQKHLVLIRSLQTSTLIVKNGVFGSAEIKQLKRFCDERFFDIAYYDGLLKSGVNRYNILDKPYFFKGTKALFENREDFFGDYKFDIRPAFDDRPYFYHFFKWETLGEIFALRGTGGLHLLEWGYLVLAASLLQAVVASFILILFPLMGYKKAEKITIATSRKRVLIYFFALGLGFLFLEIYFIQRFILFLSHPLYTIAVVLSSFLIFAGLGSSYSKRLAARKGYRKSAQYGIVGIFVFGLFYILTLDHIFGFLLTQAAAIKIVASVALIAPLAFAMGIPFPMGLSELGRHSESLIPWAWGVNGCASVIAAIAATLVAIHFGFIVVMILALLFYLAALAFFPGRLWSQIS
ncbi:MAG: SAM-dependent methyltransferase [Campylobacterota bacterium]|nr:SAM-dependent methyltransferase [Campylobacterota bacterium]